MKRRPTALPVALLLTVALVLASCDFTHVDQAARTPVEDLSVALATADTPEKARVAIDNLFRKAEIGIDWKDGAFSEYVFSRDGLDRLAAAQARFVNGDPGAGATMKAAYDRLLDSQARVRDMDLWQPGQDRAVTADFDAVMAMFRASLRNALAHPEAPGSALLFAVAAEPDGRVANVWFDEEAAASKGGSYYRKKKLSPTQWSLYYLWQHKYGWACNGNGHGNGNGGGGVNQCPSGTTLIAKFEYDDKGTNTWVFEKPAGNESIITLTGDDEEADWTLNDTDYRIDIIQFKAATTITPITVAGQTEGTVTKDRHGLSNIIFCGEDVKSCWLDCKAQLAACLASGGDEETCQEAYRTCDLGCHDQGSGGTED